MTDTATPSVFGERMRRTEMGGYVWGDERRGARLMPCRFGSGEWPVSVHGPTDDGGAWAATTRCASASEAAAWAERQLRRYAEREAAE